MPNGNITITRGGTFERVTLRDTFLGALLMWVGAVGVRVFAIALLVLCAVLFGRAFGFLGLGFSVFSLFLKRAEKFPYFTPRHLKNLSLEKQNTYALAIGLSVILSLAALLNIVNGFRSLPALRWGMYELEFWWITDTASGRLPVFLTWLRWAFLLAAPWVFIEPTRWLAWVFKWEQLMPKFRETMFKPANPESIPLPDGERVQMATNSAQVEQERASADPSGGEGGAKFQITVS